MAADPPPLAKLRGLIRRVLRLSDDRGQPEGAVEASAAPLASHVLVDRGSRRLAHEIGRAFAEKLQLEELIPFAVARCREVLDAESVAVLLYDRETEELYFPYVAAQEPTVATQMLQIRFPADRGVAGAVLRSRKSVRIDDAPADDRFYPGVDQQMGQTTRALLCVPLIAPTGVIGVIEAVNLRGAAMFTDDDLALLEALAESLAAAIQNAGAGAAIVGRDNPGLEKQNQEAETGNLNPATVFRREGDYWTIVFEGRVARLKDAKGLHYIAHLLRYPGQEFHVSQLIAAIGDAETDLAPEARTEPVDWDARASDTIHERGLGDAGAVLDAKAKAAYKQRLDDLREELEEAERFNDPGRVSRAREEIEFITNQLAAAVGLGGRDRVAASDAERARLAVTKRIKAALAKIRDANPALAQHLSAAITTGYFCSYAPKADASTSWSLE